MIRFSKQVDLRSRRSMEDYLNSHFRYNTTNSWNPSQSYACNLKIYQLGLEPEIAEKLYDMLDTQEFLDLQRELLEDFSASHQYQWQAYMNGRSGGYLVLYQGEQVPSQYKSFCTVCGQPNFSSVLETGNQCGRCRQAARKDYSSPPMQIITFTGRGVDEYEEFDTWGINKLRDRVRLIQEFDHLADQMVAEAIYLAKNYTVEEEEIFLPQKQKILVPAIS